MYENITLTTNKGKSVQREGKSATEVIVIAGSILETQLKVIANEMKVDHTFMVSSIF